MQRVGILVGRERSFPAALIEKINERGGGDVVAELVKVGGVRLDWYKSYDLIIDRISHQVPFYRGFLKRAALEGTILINNPFWWSADDKFFNYSLAAKLGVAIPRTVLLPQKEYIEDITGESLRNLEFPLDWQGIVDYVGFPAIIKPFDGGGWKNVSRVNNLEELWRVFDTTGTLCMTLQEMVDFDKFVRCYCIGQEQVMIMPYDPRKAYLSGEQYLHDPNYLSPELADRVGRDVLTLCRALGYDINTVEFAIKGDTPYAIDFMNPAPDADIESVGEFYHKWVTNAVTDLVFKRLSEPPPAPRYRWDALLNPVPSVQTTGDATSGGDSTNAQAQGSIIPEPVREFTADVAAGITDVFEEATSAISGIFGSATQSSTGESGSEETEASAASTGDDSPADQTPTGETTDGATGISPFMQSDASDEGDSASIASDETSTAADAGATGEPNATAAPFGDIPSAIGEPQTDATKATKRARKPSAAKNAAPVTKSKAPSKKAATPRSKKPTTEA